MKIRESDLGKFLNRFTFISWDRVIPSIGDGSFAVYGWIDRDTDTYKDFVLLTFWYEDKKWVEDEKIVVGLFFTSSTKYTKEINALCGFSEEDHTDCIKIEEYLSKLKEKEEKAYKFDKKSGDYIDK